MGTYCYIKKCNWIDQVDNLFDHMEKYHRDHIIEVNSNNRIELSLNEFMIQSKNQKPLLLCTETGLYWFLRHKKSSEEMLVGIYYVVNSENINYTIRFGKKSDGFVMYYGGYKTERDTTLNECRNDIYPISYNQYDIDNMTQHNVTTVHIILHTENEWIDSEEYPLDQHCIEWKDVSIELNNKLIESSENKHNVCERCMNLYKTIQNTDQCPVCRDTIQYDTRNCALEKLASVLKWPNYEDVNINILENDFKEEEGVEMIAITDNDLLAGI